MTYVHIRRNLFYPFKVFNMYTKPLEKLYPTKISAILLGFYMPSFLSKVSGDWIEFYPDCDIMLVAKVLITLRMSQ